jgi:antitoxin component YwqK of YwqJK toxin-antitoxin module
LTEAPLSIGSAVVKSVKFITLSDSNGAMHFIYRNGTLKGIDNHPDGKIKGINKYYPNPMVYSIFVEYFNLR